MAELEIRLHVEPARRARLLDALGRRGIRRSTFAAIQFDTPDLLLARHRFTVQLCNEDGRWVQRLEGSPGRAREPLADELAVDGAPAAAPLLDIDRHRHSEIGRRLRALLRRAGQPALVERCRTVLTRRRRLLNAHGADVAWVLDEGMATVAGRSSPVCALGLEFRRGDPAGLYALAQDWIALHGLWIDPVPTAEHATLLIEQRAFVPAQKALPPPWSAKEAATLGGAALLRRMVGACLAQILANAGEIARGSDDAEHVHQLRVGLRRLRAAARGMQRFAAAMPHGWEAAIMPAFEALGDARDAHVRSTSIARALRRAGAPVCDAPAPARADARKVLDVVRGASFQRTLIRLLAFARDTGADDQRADDGAALEGLTRRLRKLARQVTRAAHRFEDLPIARQHRVRKRLKRLRYLAEFAAPAFHRDAVRAWLAAVAPAQDDLGRYIDFVQAGARFAALAPTEPGAWFAVGWLRARAKRAARAGRKSLERLRRATGFWVR